MIAIIITAALGVIFLLTFLRACWKERNAPARWEAVHFEEWWSGSPGGQEQAEYRKSA